MTFEGRQGEDLTPETVVADLVGAGFHLWAEGDRIRVRSGDRLLTDAEVMVLAEGRSAVLDLLKGRRIGPLSSVQNRLWFLGELDPSATGHIFALAYRITGPCPDVMLRAALRGAVDRHPALRFTFGTVEGIPVRFTGSVPPLALPVVDAAEADLAVVLRDHLIRPFDLANGPLLRSVLVRTGPRVCVWGMAVHHLVADGKTLGILVEEVSAALKGLEPETATLDYDDFVARERAAAAIPATLAHLDYWTTRLTDPPDAELPLDRPRGPVRAHRGGRVDFTVPAALADRLAETACDSGTTPFAALLAVHALQLGRYTGRTDLTVGVPVAGRLDTGFARTAGCFVSTVVPRLDLSGDPDFGELVTRVGEVCAEAWDHQDYSYADLIARLSPDRDPSRNALFQTFFAYQNAYSTLELPNATAEIVPFDTGTVQFDLELHFMDAPGGGYTGSYLYDQDLFDRRTIEDLAGRWLLLADAATAAPQIPVLALPMATAQDSAIIERINQTARSYPQDRRVDELVAMQARRTPGKTALVFGALHLTYREMDDAVNRLVIRLRRAGGRGTKVGVFLDRCPELVIALLAVSRAGAAFVPMSPDLPAERLAWMAEDSEMTLAFSRPDLATLLPAGIASVDATLVDVVDSSNDVLELDARPATDCAYVLFTSGSTGRPKGVTVAHRSLTNLLVSMAAEPGLTHDDVFVAVTQPFFDIALLELFGPLIAGACLVVADDLQVAHPEALAGLLESASATVMQATPSTWQMLVEAGWTGRPGLRVWCGGEPLNRDLATRLVADTQTVWNLYGPTETTIWSAVWQVRAGEMVRIGRPIANTTFHVLDSAGSPVPPGVPGELYIGGDGVAIGYLGRPEETSARFVSRGGERLYRSGDIVRQFPDGDLVFLGRTDLQLKVRGFRIEPEEIEAALRRHPDVQDAVVTLGPTGALVGHVTGPRILDEPALRQIVAERVPPYAVPRALMLHDRFPETANRKIDRRALGALSPRSEGASAMLPEGPYEEFVAEAYAQLLGTEQVGRLSDFFALGGHSLLIGRLLHQIRTRFGVDPGPRDVFRDPTVSGVAASIQVRHARADTEAALIEAALAELEQLSDEEAEQLLDHKGNRSPNSSAQGR